MNEELNPCPFCGSADGYFLGEGDTYRWWEVACRSCGELVTECRADPHMTVNREPPPRSHANADAAWQEATKHHAMVCANVDRLIAREATLAAALELIAAPMRPDGTWNRDREACRQIAAAALAGGAQ